MTKHISLNLGGAWNSRDVASITNIKPGVLLRSANLAKLSNSGQEKLLELGVTDVIDLRSEREIKQDGIDKLPASINYHFLPIDPGDVSNLKGTLGGSIAESVFLSILFAWYSHLARGFTLFMFSRAESIAASP